MREERRALEDHVDGALVRRNAGDVPALEDDAPLGRPDEPGEDPQQRRLAAARGAEQRDELTVADLERDVVEGDDLPVPVRDPVDLEPGGAVLPHHASAMSPPRPRRRVRAALIAKRNATTQSSSVIAMSRVEIVLIDGSTVRRRLDQMNMRERRVGPDHEERDDELVEREREGERGRTDEDRPDLGQRHPPEHDPRRGAEVGGRLLERTVEPVERRHGDEQEVREDVDEMRDHHGRRERA